MLDAKVKESFPAYIDSNKFTATYEFSNVFYEHVKCKVSSNNTIVVLCIGTDRATGDSLGPLIGYKLNSHKNLLDKKIKVYGTLESPVHAKNLSDTISVIYNSYKNPYVIAIDACLGRLEYIGYMTIGEGAVRPGAGVKKNLPSVGDMHITGIVNYNGVLDSSVLQNTRLAVVMKMADIISNGLISVFEKLK